MVKNVPHALSKPPSVCSTEIAREYTEKAGNDVRFNEVAHVAPLIWVERQNVSTTCCLACTVLSWGQDPQLSTDAGPRCTWPFAQPWHVPGPSATLKVPAGQSSQFCDPEVTLYLPGSQALHGPPSGPLYPALQLHTALPRSAKLFSGH
eukprot:3493592-Rhodomonas_salina.1